MTDDFKTEAPTLTFEPFMAEQKETVSAPQTNKLTIEQEYETYPLSDEEKKVIDDFASQIDLYNSQLVLQYGAGAQKKISDFSEQALENVKSKDLGEVGQMLSNVVSELKSFDAEEEDRGFFGNIFKKSSNKISSMKSKFSKAEANVDSICKVLEGHQIQLLKDSAMLDQMYKMNTNYYKELTMYIIAGKKKLAKAEQEEIPAMLKKAEASGLADDMNAANDYTALCDRFDKKIHDLELTRMVAMQMAPQIRLIQNNDILMSEKIQSMLVNTIPLWKSQMVLALGVNHSKQAAEAQRQVTDMTNELLRKNAETLKLASVETAKELERGVVDVETLTTTNEMLISTIDDVMKIQNEGRAKRREAEVQLTKLENDLKAKLLEINKKRMS
ncbi:MAG: toxic anion resistance protein [Catenibacillus sp.]|nr:toxic anion resistance protein [Catenibacillus sp.]